MALLKSKTVELSIIIPAYNEEARIFRTLDEIAHKRKKLEGVRIHEVIVVNDGSTDKTSQVIREHTDGLPVQELALDENLGKGGALRKGVEKATGDLILTCDADGATPITEINKLVHAIHKENSDIAIGSRMLGRKPEFIRLHRKIISYFYRILYLPIIPNIMDASCGFKLYKQKAAKTIFAQQRFNDFSHDVEILFLANRNNFSISEVPVKWTSIPGSKVHIVRDSVRMFFGIMAIYFFYRKRP